MRKLPIYRDMRIMKILIAIACLHVFGTVAFAQTKRALIIGLGEQEDKSWGKINGDKDIPIVTEMLLYSGYKKKDIVTLVNKQATKSGIISAFENLTKSCRKKDIIYIHFSGHGQRVTDIDGDETNGWDESWIPYDAYRKYGIKDRGEKHLIDDEIYNLLVEIKRRVGVKGKIMVVADACHSGGSSFEYGTFPFNDNTLSYEDDIITRGVSDSFIIPLTKRGKIVKAPEQWITLSACKSFQTNQELKNPHVGILSYALYIVSKKGNIKMWEIEDFIRQNKGPYPQTPELTGEVEKYNISDFLK